MTEYYLIYDDTCSICSKYVEMVQKLDKKSLITLVELSRPELPDYLALPSHEAISDQLHLFDTEGKLWVGADAIAQLALMFRSSRVLGRVLGLPGIRALASRFYKVVARNRLRGHRIDK